MTRGGISHTDVISEAARAALLWEVSLVLSFPLFALSFLVAPSESKQGASAARKA